MHASRRFRTPEFPPLTRRNLLISGAAATGTLIANPLQAQPRASASKAPYVAQIVDMSSGQQDISRDFIVGARVAWQSAGGSKPVRCTTVEIDGSPESLVRAVEPLIADQACVALCGTTGDQISLQLMSRLATDNIAMAHVAPWLQNSDVRIDDRTFPIFASREEQINHALKSSALVGIKSIAVAYGSAQDHATSSTEIESVARGLGLQLQSFRADTDLASLARRLDRNSAPIVLFVGGTPEFIQFSVGLEKQARQRYVIALAEVNLQTLIQLGAAMTTPVIATQTVPRVNRPSVPVVRRFREALARLFDEPPSNIGLSGFISASYAIEVLKLVDGPLTRSAVLAAFQRRPTVDLGGFRISPTAQGRSLPFVTQTMLTPDGRLIG